MKKYKLCYECEASQDCTRTCKEAIKFEKLDCSANYSKVPYIAKNTFTTCQRMQGGFGAFGMGERK